MFDQNLYSLPGNGAGETRHTDDEKAVIEALVKFAKTHKLSQLQLQNAVDHLRTIGFHQV
jgi:hypothetical protein